MKSPNNEGAMTYPGHLLSLNEAYSDNAGCYQLKGYNANARTTQTVFKTIGSSKPTDSKTLLLKTTPTHFTEHAELELMPTYTLPPHVLMPMTWKGTLKGIRRVKET